MDQPLSLKEKVDDIHRVIAGNPQYGQPGIKDILEDHKTRIMKLEKDQTKNMVKAGFIGSGLTLSSIVITIKAFGAKAWAAFIELFI